MSAPDLVPIRRAVLSVSNKADLAPFARALADRGVEIISTGGTARVLSEAGIKVVNISDVTGYPEMMDGRVKTLHPSVHGALLARRDNVEHVAAMEAHGVAPIDLVCINLYPFEQTIRKDGVTIDEAIEQIDIGGPAMLRSAAKNHDFVTVVTSPTQYDRIVTELRTNDGATTLATRRDLAAAAFSRTAQYDAAISAWMAHQREESFPAQLRLSYTLQEHLRYGENPHQQAALYANPTSPDPSLVHAALKHGKPLSYNNINDGAAALDLVRELHLHADGAAAAAVMKHANPCGAAIADTPVDAFERAYAGDPRAAFGGILAVNATVDAALAEAVAEGQKFLEVIVAPQYDDDGLAILQERWKNVRLLAVGAFDFKTDRRKIDYRSVPGGMLVQERDTALPSARNWQVMAGPAPSDATLRDAEFTMTIAKHLKSNAIAIGRDGQMLGGGPGQVDRVSSCEIAIAKAGDRLRDGGGVAASDAFFPFPDGPEKLIDAGVTCIVQPGGSKRDEETFALCEQRGVTCIVTGQRHFRH